VEAFFIHVNVLYPLLHRPTFARWLEAGLHARDDDLGSIVLLLCAVAARFIDDVRVLDGTALASAGWKYYAQVATVRTALHPAPSLADLQRACVSACSLSHNSCIVTLLVCSFLRSFLRALPRLRQRGR
jgi:phage tail protein X